MIEICDPQSGLRFEELWDWWKKHKQEDMNKQIKVYSDEAMQKLQQPQSPPFYLTKFTC